jgi:hypothetical protein
MIYEWVCRGMGEAGKGGGGGLDRLKRVMMGKEN